MINYYKKKARKVIRKRPLQQTLDWPWKIWLFALYFIIWQKKKNRYMAAAVKDHCNPILSIVHLTIIGGVMIMVILFIKEKIH
jgi:hypothetical protein